MGYHLAVLFFNRRLIMKEKIARPLEVAVIRFPGSNCDFDTLKFFHNDGHHAEFLWHEETTIPKADLLFLPGGFAFGDRKYKKATSDYTIDPGVQALSCPVMRVVDQWVKDDRPILGVCNGFQILVHAGILPGKLEQNDIKKFYCDDIDVMVEGRSFFNSRPMLGNVYHINVAHGYGRYVVAPEEYAALLENDQIFLRYHGINPNGSTENIAGICNEAGNVFAMMPHLERTDRTTQRVFLEAIENYVRS